MENAPCFLKETRRESQNVIISIKLRYLDSTAIEAQYCIQIVEERDYCLFPSWNLQNYTC